MGGEYWSGWVFFPWNNAPGLTAWLKNHRGDKANHSSPDLPILTLGGIVLEDLPLSIQEFRLLNARQIVPVENGFLLELEFVSD